MATTKWLEIFNLLMRRARRIRIDDYSCRTSKHTFTQFEHLSVLVFKTVCRASYRTLATIVPCVLGRDMHFTTPQKAARRLGPQLLLRLLRACLPAVRGRIVAIDSTGFSMDTRSPYFTHRIFAGKPRGFVKTSLLVDTRTTAILYAAMHIIPRHDIRDAHIVRHHRGAKHLVADKAYDAEWLHEQVHACGMRAHIPSRARARDGFWRKKHAKTFAQRIYNQRPLIETTNSVVKRRWGGNIAAHNIVMIRIEILLKLLTHNLFLIRKSILWMRISTGLKKTNIVLSRYY